MIREFLVFKGYQTRCRQKRGEIFKRYLEPGEDHLILDLGGGSGSYISQLLPFKKNVYIGDIDENKLRKSAAKGFRTVLLGEDGSIPYRDGYFDIIFCSSVIEHVTVDKKELESIHTNKEFRKLALKRQKKFADEIRRVSKCLENAFPAAGYPGDAAANPANKDHQAFP